MRILCAHKDPTNCFIVPYVEKVTIKVRFIFVFNRNLTQAMKYWKVMFYLRAEKQNAPSRNEDIQKCLKNIPTLSNYILVCVVKTCSLTFLLLAGIYMDTFRTQKQSVRHHVTLGLMKYRGLTETVILQYSVCNLMTEI